MKSKQTQDRRQNRHDNKAIRQTVANPEKDRRIKPKKQQDNGKQASCNK